jgi:hypothetical protein
MRLLAERSATWPGLKRANGVDLVDVPSRTLSAYNVFQLLLCLDQVKPV